MALENQGVLDDLAERACGFGADRLEVEYKDGHEEVVAIKGSIGVGIGRFPSSGPIAAQLRAELDDLVSRRRRVVVAGQLVEMRAREYDSFGETAYRVELRRVEKTDAPDGARPPSRSLRQRRR